MFVALDKEGKLSNILSFTKEELQQIQSQSFFCPVCKSSLIIKQGIKKRIHFAHKIEECSQSAKESTAHLLAKEKLFHFFSSKNIPIKMEYPIIETNQRADLFISLGSKKYVIEFQHSIISEKDIKLRIRNYTNLAIIQVWLIDSKIIKRKKNIILLSPFQTEIIRASPQSLLHLYDPNTHILTIIHSILFIHATKIIAKEEKFLLSKSSIACFFSFRPKKDYLLKAFFQQIEVEKKNILLFYQSHQDFVFSCYQSHLVLASLWWIGLPTKYNDTFFTSCVIWQGYLYLFIKNKKYFTIDQCFNYLVDLIHKGEIRISIEEDEIIKMAIQQYLDLLVKLIIIMYEGDYYNYIDSFFERDEEFLVNLLLQTL